MVTLKVMEAIHRFHASEDMYYGDVKPGNILISKEWEIKFDDFGLSHFFRGCFYGYLHGLTVGFCKPEVEYYMENHNSDTIPKDLLVTNDVFGIHVTLCKYLLPSRKMPNKKYHDIINKL